jgi:hypothetical protein
MAKKLLLLVGNSHANCLANALKRKLFPAVSERLSIRVVAVGSAAFPGDLVMTDGEGQRIPNPVVLSAINEACRATPRPEVWLLSIIGGNHASRLGMFRPALATHVALKGEDIPAELDAEVFVPVDAIATTLRRQLSGLEEFFGLISEASVAGWMHLEAPPPCADSDWLFEHLPLKTIEAAAGRGLPPPRREDVSPASFRKRLWTAQTEVVREIVERHRGHYLLPPAEARDVDGCLPTRLCSDAVHGNLEYGRLCLEMVSAHLEGLPSSRGVG